MDDVVDGNTLDDDEGENITRTIVIAEDTQICCEKNYEECHCAFPINAPDIYDKTEPHWYEDDTECMNCVFIGTPACPPLRAAYRMIVRTGEIPASIIPCGSFKLAQI